MAVTFTGPMGKLLDNAEDLLAASSTFQTWVEAETAAAAEASIHVCSLPGASAAWPAAYVMLADALVYNRSSATGFRDTPEGSIAIRIEAEPTSTETSKVEQEKYFIDKIDNVVKEIATLSGTGEYLNCLSITTQFGDDGSPWERVGHEATTLLVAYIILEPAV